MDLTEKDKIVIIGALDELLMKLGTDEQFTEEEREEIAYRYETIFDETAPKDVRKHFSEIARSLYDEIKEDDGDGA